MALIIDERLLEPNGEVEITENFNRVLNIIDNSSGSGSGAGSGGTDPDYTADVDAFYDNIPDEYVGVFFNSDDSSRIYLKDMLVDGFTNSEGQWTDQAHRMFALTLFDMFCEWLDSFGDDGPTIDDEFLFPYDESHMLHIYELEVEEEENDNGVTAFCMLSGNISGTLSFIGYPNYNDGVLITYNNGQPPKVQDFNSLVSAILNTINIDHQEEFAELIESVIPNADDMTF